MRKRSYLTYLTYIIKKCKIVFFRALLCFACDWVPAKFTYRQTFNVRRALIDNIIVDNSDVGAAPTTSSLST